MNRTAIVWICLCIWPVLAAGESQTDAFGRSLAALNLRIKKEVPPGHELAAYLAESADIIKRLIAAIDEDALSKTPSRRFDVEIQTAECRMLLASLKTELDLIARNSAGGKTVSVKHFGSVGDGKHDDGPALRKALQAAAKLGPGARLEIPAGRYAIDSLAGGAHFTVSDCSDLTIAGRDKVTFVMKKVATGLLIDNCSNVRIRNINIDYDPLPYTLGTIVATDPDHATFDMKLRAGYPKPDSKIFLSAAHLRGTVRDPRSGKLYRKEGDLRAAGVTARGDGVYRIKVADNQKRSKPGMTANFPKGHLWSLHARAARGGGCAVVAKDSSFVLLDAVNVYASYSHSYLAVACDGLKMLNCVSEPMPGAKRVACNNADGLHCPTNRKGPYLEKCRFLRLNDDCLNMYSKAYCVAKVDAPTEITLDLRIGGSGGDPIKIATFRPGDPLVFLNPRNAEIEGFARVGGLARKQWKNRPCLGITLDRKLTGILSRDKLGKGPAGGREYVGPDAKKANAVRPIEHFVVNLAFKSDGFVIRNCLFGENRAAGIKFKASNGVMRNTTIRGDMYAACLFKIALDWREGYFPRNILLQGNELGTRKAISKHIGLAAPGHADHKKFIRRIVVKD